MPDYAWLHEFTTVEWIAAIATLLNVWLVVKADVRNFPVGVVAVLAYAWVFWKSQLYANLVLQLVYYLPFQFIGWWVWLRTGPAHDDDLPIRRLSFRENAAWLGGTLAASVAVGVVLARMTDGHAPFLDASTTVASVVGQYMLTRKWLENWYYWLVIDAVYAFWLFPSQHLWASTGLYVILPVLAVIGAARWTKAAQRGAVHT